MTDQNINFGRPVSRPVIYTGHEDCEIYDPRYVIERLENEIIKLRNGAKVAELEKECMKYWRETLRLSKDLEKYKRNPKYPNGEVLIDGTVKCPMCKAINPSYNRAYGSNVECCVCMNHPSEIYLITCGHICLCVNCMNKLIVPNV